LHAWAVQPYTRISVTSFDYLVPALDWPNKKGLENIVISDAVTHLKKLD
jgi:hypothetical protein